MQVAATFTPSDPATVAGALIWAYQQATGRAPPATSSWLMVLAQSALETGHWTAMYGYNLGYISQPDKSQPYYYRGTNPVPFAVYPNLGAGALAMMKLLNGFYGALTYADNNDLAGYVAQLQAKGYAGSDPQTYVNYQSTMASLMQQYAGVVPTPYSPGAGATIGAPLTTLQAAAVGATVVAAAMLAAYALLPKTKRPTWPGLRAGTR